VTAGSERTEEPVETSTGQPPVGIDELLERVRDGYKRVGPHEAHEAARAGEALLVDIRYAALR
jgi:hypothetical protein